MEKVELFRAAKAMAYDRRSLYKGSIKDRDKLLDFLEMNGWFGLDRNEIMRSKDVIFITEDHMRFLSDKLRLWMDGFRRSNSDKLELLLAFGEKSLPQTVSCFGEYIRAESRNDDISSWRLLDFLLYHLPGEITEIDTAAEGRLVDKLDREATRSVAELYAGFHEWLQKKLGISGWRYKFEYRKKRDEIEAYTVSQFSHMAYCVFNDEWWEKQQMVEKACGSAAYANLWAFIAMHFVCGLRSTDIIRLPMPDLGCDGDTFREKVLSGIFEKPEAISQDMQIRVRYRPGHPNKTAAGSDIPELKVFIPVTLEKPVGTILGIAASHCDGGKPGDRFIHPDRSISRTRGFFGKEFMETLGGKGFASSRANKAYLQGLEMMADASEGNVKGYMIAALARSHKGGFATLPDVTDIYLRDAAFSGYKPEFIAREMFERGVFGFVPHLLLEVYAGNDYTQLSIPDQTRLIKNVGIRPSGIESIVRICESSLARARDTVADIVASKADIAVLVQEIASGRAVSRQDGCLCVMTAGGFTCPYPDRAACMGCRYEIHTKSVLHQLSSEYARMKRFSDGPDGWRYRAMIREAILPVIGEYLATVKEQIPEIDMDAMAEIMEGGVSGYDNGGEQAGGNRLQQVSCS